MARPQKENGFTGIANEIIENIVKLPLNGTQLRIILIVFRYTYGFSRKEHELSVSFLCEALGLNKNTQYKQISREIKTLIEMNLLIVSKPDKNKTRLIEFNKDYDLWTNKSSGLKSPLDKLVQTSKKSIPLKTAETKDSLTSGLISPLDGLVHQEIKNINKNIYSALFEKVWTLYPNKKGKGKVSDTQKKELLEVGFEQLSRCIERYKKSKPDWQAWQNGSTFFNKGYIDYLDSEYEEQYAPIDQYRKVKA